jgi:hypothetical protein
MDIADALAELDQSLGAAAGPIWQRLGSFGSGFRAGSMSGIDDALGAASGQDTRGQRQAARLADPYPWLHFAGEMAGAPVSAPMAALSPIAAALEVARRRLAEGDTSSSTAGPAVAGFAPRAAQTPQPPYQPAASEFTTLADLQRARASSALGWDVGPTDRFSVPWWELGGRAIMYAPQGLGVDGGLTAPARLLPWSRPAVTEIVTPGQTGIPQTGRPVGGDIASRVMARLPVRDRAPGYDYGGPVASPVEQEAAVRAYLQLGRQPPGGPWGATPEALEDFVGRAIAEARHRGLTTPASPPLRTPTEVPSQSQETTGSAAPPPSLPDWRRPRVDLFLERDPRLRGHGWRNSTGGIATREQMEEAFGPTRKPPQD